MILNGGQGTVADIQTWEKASFEALINAHPKGIVKFAG